MGMTTIYNLTEADALATLEPYDETNANTTSHLFLDIDDNYKLKGIFFDDSEPNDKVIKCISCEQGASAVPVGRSVFVSQLGDDSTGLRERYDLMFLTLEAARDSALAGDTIYVYGGSYSVFSDLHKTGVNWVFTGRPIITVFSSTLFADGGATETIDVKGDAIITHSVVGQVLDFRDASTVANLEFHSVSGLGAQIFFLEGGRGVINVKEDITCTLINNCIRFNNNASYTINADRIICNATVGIANGIHGKNSGLFTGRCIVNARLIQNGVGNIYQAVRMDYATYTGTVIINVIDKIERLNVTAIDPQTNNTVMHLGGNLEINGDIEGLFGHAIQISGDRVKTFIHNGNATNNGDLSVVGDGQGGIAFWLNNNGITKLNGIYESDSIDVITHGGAGSKLTLNGRSVTNSQDAGTTTCMNIRTPVSSAILDVANLINNNLVGTPLSSDADGAQDVLVFNSGGSNVAKGANITYQIKAFTVDALYE